MSTMASTTRSGFEVTAEARPVTGDVLYNQRSNSVAPYANLAQCGNYESRIVIL